MSNPGNKDHNNPDKGKRQPDFDELGRPIEPNRNPEDETEPGRGRNEPKPGREHDPDVIPGNETFDPDQSCNTPQRKV